MTDTRRDGDNAAGAQQIFGQGGTRAARRQLVEQLQARWQAGQPANAVEALQEYPELQLDKSIVMDLGLEEYLQRTKAGEKVDADDFCQRFPKYQTSLRRLLEVQDILIQSSDSLHPDEPLDWPQPREEFLGYELLEELGRGAFARVFLAREIHLGGRLVAVKIAPRGAVEAETLGRLKHPNIVPVHSVHHDADSDLTAVCMDFSGRATFCDLLEQAYGNKRRPRDASVIAAAVRSASDEQPEPADVVALRAASAGSYINGVLRLAVQLADALAYTHSQRILHLDLKPSNVLLTAAGRPMLLDFNLSHDEQAGDLRLGGTLPYMSPEQIGAAVTERAEGNPEVDHRSDLFSLGVILYELLCGRPPFGLLPRKVGLAEAGAWLLERQHSGPASMRSVNPQLDERLAGLIEQCLACNPTDRPQSAAELATALRSHLSPWARGRRWILAHPQRALASALLAIAVICSGIVFWATRAPYAERQLAAGRAALQAGDPASSILHLDAALQAKPLLREALILRGRALQQQGNYDEALASIERAAAIGDNGELSAAMAYCLALAERHDKAIQYGKTALDAEYDEAEVHNNLGFSYLRRRNLLKAGGSFNAALRVKADLVPALYNRTLLEIETCRSNPEYVPEQGLRDIRLAIKVSPSAPDLWVCKAQVLAAFEAADVANAHDQAEPLDLLRQAHRAGYDLRVIAQDPLFEKIRGRLKSEGLLTAPPNPPPAATPRLIDPLGS